ncbi:hypothetical protein GS982_20010 [Rhodococcus hoagii]|nr:hypothetical protein [Prescottella equi]NKZ84488.1 hypothetical protein [Prescottella equi]
MSATDLYVLYRQTGDAVELDMGGTARDNRRRTFTREVPAVNYARKHDAKVVCIRIPVDGPPVVVGVIDPKERNQ